MTVQRSHCTAAQYVRLDRHMVTDRRRTLTDPAGVETVVCSLACVVTWCCRHIAADVTGSSDGTTGEAA